MPVGDRGLDGGGGVLQRLLVFAGVATARSSASTTSCRTAPRDGVVERDERRVVVEPSEHRPGAADGLPERVGDLVDPPFGVVDLVGRQRHVGRAASHQRAGTRSGIGGLTDQLRKESKARSRRVDGAVVEMGRHELGQGADPDVGGRSDVGRGECLERRR